MGEIVRDPILKEQEKAWNAVRAALGAYEREPSDSNAEAVQDAWLELRRLSRVARWRMHEQRASRR
jgi:hypothetical protein